MSEEKSFQETQNTPAPPKLQKRPSIKSNRIENVTPKDLKNISNVCVTPTEQRSLTQPYDDTDSIEGNLTDNESNENVNESDSESNRSSAFDETGDSHIQNNESVADDAESSIDNCIKPTFSTYHGPKPPTCLPTTNLNDKYDTKTLWLFCSFLIIFVAVVAKFPLYNATAKESFDIEEIKENFPNQDEFLWLAFEAGVQDVLTLNRPSTFILLYQEEAENMTARLVDQLSKYAICNLTGCSQEPIIITDTWLHSSEVLDDYGVVIDKYRDELKDKGVMIIKNLENVPGVSAQAFHSLCDEFTPLVEKSLFIFTMKVDKFYGHSRLKYVEEYFRTKWTDIKIDTFNALITRITSMVLEVMP